MRVASPQRSSPDEPADRPRDPGRQAIRRRRAVALGALSAVAVAVAIAIVISSRGGAGTAGAPQAVVRFELNGTTVGRESVGSMRRPGAADAALRALPPSSVVHDGRARITYAV